jgi:hypothetical protein
MTDQVMSAMCIGVEDRPRAALRTGRTLPAVAVAAVVALLVAACDSSPSPSAGGSTTSASAVAFSVCMRSHGVPRYPDPPPQAPAGFPAVVGSAHDVGVSQTRLQSAERACYHTLPIDDTKLNRLSLAQCELLGDCPPVLVQQALTQLEKFARWMRSHGVPRWPDPVIGEGGAPLFVISTSKDGFDPYSPQIETKDNECTHVEHPNTGEPLGTTP